MRMPCRSQCNVSPAQIHHPESVSCNKKSIAPKRLTGAWPWATLNYATAPQITQMEVILQSEVTVSTMDVLTLQQWPEESKSINEACDIIFQSPPLFLCFLSFVHTCTTCCLSLRLSLSLHSSFSLPVLLLRTIYSEGGTSPQIATPTRFPQLVSVQTDSVVPVPALLSPPPTRPWLLLTAYFQPHFPHLNPSLLD